MKIQRRKKINKIKSCKHKRITRTTIITSPKRNGGVTMIELTKPLSYGFIVREDKVEEFLNHKRDKSKLERVLRKASRMKKNIGVHE
jgi:hypothetical protein